MTTNVKQVMTKRCITVPIGTTVEKALKLMETKRIRHLPVIDVLDDIVGVVSRADLGNLGDGQQKVEEFMSSPVFYIDGETPLRKAALLMMERKISSLFVSDKNEEAIGIITTDDLLWYLTHLLRNESSSSSAKYLLKLQTLGEVVRELGQMGI